MDKTEVFIQSTPAPANKRRQEYLDRGFLFLPGLIDSESLSLLQSCMTEAVDASRGLSESNHQFSLGKGHSAETPNLEKVAFVDDLVPDCWNFCRDSIITDLAEEILGSDLRFGDISIDYKWAEGDVGVKWHQDIAFYPHANMDTCQFMLAMSDVCHNQGSLQIIPGSHKDKVYPHYPNYGNWTGAIEESDLCHAKTDNAIELCGPVGSVSVHHGCTIHRSMQNSGFEGRPVFLITYCAADAVPYTTGPFLSSHFGEMIRGVISQAQPYQIADLLL